jgi:hypothetical protein
MGFHTIKAHGRQGKITGFINFFSKIGYDDFLPVHQNSDCRMTLLFGPFFIVHQPLIDYAGKGA